MNDLRLELRLRNNVLWHAIFDTHASVAEFGRAHHIDGGQVGDLLNLKRSPYLKTNDSGLSVIGRALCAITGLGSGELFPPDLYSGVLPTMRVAEVPSSRLMALSAASCLSLPAAQIAAVENDERRSLLRMALGTLTKREQRVLSARFGLDTGEERTLREIGDELGVSVERIRQIESKGLRKLRHPSRLNTLEPYHPGQ